MRITLRVILVSVLTILSFLVLLPNFSNKDYGVPKINLGLDLQGGSHLLLEVDFKSYTIHQLENLSDKIKEALRSNRLGYRNFKINDARMISFDLRNPKELQDSISVVKGIDKNLIVEHQSDTISVRYSEYKNNIMLDKVVEQSLEIVRLRIDSSGTKEPTIQKQGDRYIMVQVPGAKNPDEIKRLLGQTAKLTLHIVKDIRSEQFAHNPDEMLVKSNHNDWMIINKKCDIDGENLVDAQVSFDQYGNPAVSFELDGVGGSAFAKITQHNRNKLLAIVLDGKLLSAPKINDPILGGKGIITGSFSVQEANELALLLRAGSLPAPLKIVEERTVGPSLGSDSIESGKRAALIGSIGVGLFMLISYGVFGVFANIALCAGISYILSAMALIGATLTLPGIAGIILTIGMAVDANILIYERINEELEYGLAAHRAIAKGFDCAFGTILDSNITTLSAALLLYIFGSGAIRGFAVTLSIGVVASMFSAIVITKLMIDIWCRKNKLAAY